MSHVLTRNNNEACSISDYNCYTYAFNLPNGGWTRPYSLSEEEYEYYGGISNLFEELYNDEGWTIEEIYEKFLKDAKDFLLSNHDGLRLLSNREERLNILNDEEIVQFRFFIEFQFNNFLESEEEVDEDQCVDAYFDFHFKVFRDGEWTEKCGSSEIMSCEPWIDNTGLGDREVDDYDSPTLTFAHRKIKI